MRVLMLGWEFPPFISGGLGTACHGLTRAMVQLNTEVLFVLPDAVENASTSRTTLTRDTVGSLATVRVPSTVTSPYQFTGQATGPALAAAGPAYGLARALLCRPGLRIVGTGAPGGYEGDLVGRIEDFARRCVEMTQGEPFDVVHAHDWVTFPAGMLLAARTGKPLVVHVHSTEFDRSGEAINRPVYDIEYRGLHAAQAVIAVSYLTKRTLVERYGVRAGKVRVVHNGIENGPTPAPAAPRNGGDKTILFLGRITMQKGPEYFVRAAQRVLARLDRVRFIIAGWGDLGPRLVEQVAALGLGRQIRFAGFLRGSEVQRAYRMADVYVMPSISEPFGLTALEALRCGVPAVISKNSGVAEVLPQGALKVDFWDVERMADRIVALLRHPALGESLCRRAAEEMRTLTWEEAARKCVGVYADQVGAMRS